MELTAIVAMAENNVIGHNNDLIWHLPADLKYFKKQTSSHHIIMGRKTFESVGKPLPNRVNIVITRQPGYKAEGCTVVASLEEALAQVTGDEKPYIVGGGEIYKMALSKCDRLEITVVHHAFEGETKFPEFDKNEWEEVEKVYHPKDEKHAYDFTFYTYKKRA